MAKSNIRSIRFSDAILEMIEQQPGDSFTAKYEGLITKCCWELPRKQQELAEIQKQIDNERKHLRYIRDKKTKLERNLSNLEYSTQRMVAELNRTVKELEEL